MLARAQLIATKIHELNLSSGNVMAAATGEYDLKAIKHIRLNRAIADTICTPLFNKDKTNKTTVKTHYTFFLALMTELTRYGNCGEHSGLFYTTLLKMGIQTSVEFVAFYSKATGKHAYNHQITVLDRDTKQDVKNPAFWTNVITADTWLITKIEHYTKEDAKRLPHLAGMPLATIDVDKTKSRLRRIGNFTAAEWHEYVLFLQSTKEKITVPMLQTLITSIDIALEEKYPDMDTDSFQLDAKDFHEKLHTKIDAEIKVCQALAANPATSPTVNDAKKADQFTPPGSTQCAAAFYQPKATVKVASVESGIVPDDKTALTLT